MKDALNENKEDENGKMDETENDGDDIDEVLSENTEVNDKTMPGFGKFKRVL